MKAQILSFKSSKDSSLIKKNEEILKKFAQKQNKKNSNLEFINLQKEIIGFLNYDLSVLEKNNNLYDFEYDFLQDSFSFEDFSEVYNVILFEKFKETFPKISKKFLSFEKNSYFFNQAYDFFNNYQTKILETLIEDKKVKVLYRNNLEKEEIENVGEFYFNEYKKLVKSVSYYKKLTFKNPLEFSIKELLLKCITYKVKDLEQFAKVNKISEIYLGENQKTIIYDKITRKEKEILNYNLEDILKNQTRLEIGQNIKLIKIPNIHKNENQFYLI